MISYLIAGCMVIFILTLVGTLGYIQKFKIDDLYICLLYTSDAADE